MTTDPAVQAAAEAIAGCTSDEFAEMDRPQRVWYLNLADAALAAATPLIRVQAFTEAADAIEALRVYGLPYTASDYNAGIDRAADLIRGLGEETAST